MSVTAVSDQMVNTVCTIKYMEMKFFVFVVFLSITQNRIQVPFDANTDLVVGGLVYEKATFCNSNPLKK